MRTIVTATLAAIALALAVVIHWVDRDPAAGRDAAERARVLARFDAGEIQRVEIGRGGDVTALERAGEGGQWFLAGEHRDRADAARVDELLDQLNHLSVVDRLAESEMRGDGTLDAETLGLDGGQAIAVTLSPGADPDDESEAGRVELVFGNPAPKTGTLYARHAGENGAAVVEGDPRPLLEDPVATFRDRRLLGAPVAAIEQLSIRDSRGDVVLRRKVTEPRTDWALSSPIETWADKDRIDTLLGDLAGLEIEEVLGELDEDSAIPNPLPEGEAVVRFAVAGWEQPVTLHLRELSREKDDPAPPAVEARLSDRPWRYRVRSGIVGELTSSADDYRSRRLARIPIQYLDRLTIQSPIDPLVDLRAERLEQGIRWKVRLGNRLVPANNQGISELVEGINQSSILNFVSDSGGDLSDYGLANPSRRISFTLRIPGVPDGEGNPGPPGEQVHALRLGWKEGDEQRLFASFEGEPAIYELDPTFVNFFPTHPVKWRSLRVLSFNQFHLRSIERELPGKETLLLEYNRKRDRWSARRGGDDVSSHLDETLADGLRDRLGSFAATGWYLQLANAYRALEDPSAVFTIVTEELDPATNEARDSVRVLKLAPSPVRDPSSSVPYYFGIVEDPSGMSGETPDVFFVDPDSYKELVRPLTGSARVR